MVAHKSSKTVKELVLDFEKLKNLVISLQNEIKILKEKQTNEGVTLVNRDDKTDRRKACNKCDSTFEDVKELKQHNKAVHTFLIKCKSCDYTCSEMINLEKHIKEKHQDDESFNCEKCRKNFVTEWRLNKHMQVHSSKQNFCHYFNNQDSCPFDEFGCKFRHDKSPKCFRDSKCKRKLCQYRHGEISNVSGDVSDNEKLNNLEDNVRNNTNKAEDHIEVEVTESETMTDPGKTNINSDDMEFTKGRDFFCEHFCSNKYNLHVHKKDDHEFFKGINMKEITEKFQVETMKFVKSFTCEVCDKKSIGLDEHRKHFEDVHKDVQYEQVCLFNNCKFKSLFPEELVKHFTEKHDKSITSILKKLTQKTS